MLLAVAGEREDVDDSSNDGENDCRFWICQTVAPARKLTKQFAEDSMVILAGKWAVDVRWFKVCMCDCPLLVNSYCVAPGVQPQRRWCAVQDRSRRCLHHPARFVFEGQQLRVAQEQSRRKSRSLVP